MNKPVNNRETIILEALGDLRKTLEFAEEMGNVEFIDGADPELEIGALYEISLEEPSPPVLLFRNIKGYPPGYRVVVNVRSSKVFDRGERGLELVQTYRKHRRKRAEPIPPIVVESGPGAGKCHGGRGDQRARLPGAQVARGRRRPLHRHRMPGDHARSGQRLGQSRHLPGAGARQEHARRLHRGRQARRRDPQEILGARPALPDGGERRPVAGAGRGRPVDARPERLRIRHRRQPDRPADRGDPRQAHGHPDPGRCRDRVRGIHAAAGGSLACRKARSANGRAITPPTPGPSRCCR